MPSNTPGTEQHGLQSVDHRAHKLMVTGSRRLFIGSNSTRPVIPTPDDGDGEERRRPDPGPSDPAKEACFDTTMAHLRFHDDLLAGGEFVLFVGYDPSVTTEALQPRRP
ncbi:hypothetical protein ACIGO9_28560 [Nocardia asteroides]|uniref:hypothetical protein n=1 Tax=Nocardia asteroides TaxID=1824 RepID=UPI0037CB02DD